MGNHLAVIGETHIVPFDEKLDYDSLVFRRNRAMRKFTIEETKRILRLTNSRRNIIDKCLKEMVKKEEMERKRGKHVPIDSECLKNKCKFKKQCLRRKLHQ